MQVASYNTKRAVACAKCGGDVVVCIPEDLSYSGFPYIEGTIVSERDTVNHCGVPVYNYGIRYDENELANLFVPLTQCNINGLICRGCLTQYIDAYALFKAFCIVCTEEDFIIALANVYCKHIIVVCSFSLTDDRELPAGKIMTNLDGAVISTAGNTLTISGDLTSGAYPIFDTVLGDVVLNSGAEVYPEWFGAAGNGTDDDKEAIQLAIDTAIATGKGVIKFSAGKTYLTGSTVSIGYLAEDLVLTGYGSTLHGDFDDIILEVSDAVAASGYAKNIVIEGLRVKGSLTDHESYNNQVGIDINSVDGLVLRDVVVYDITGIGIKGYPSSTEANRVWRQVRWDHVAVDRCGLESTYISEGSYEFDPTPAYFANSLFISNCRFNRGAQLTPSDVAAVNTVNASSLYMEGSEIFDNNTEYVGGRDQISFGMFHLVTAAMLGNYFKDNGLEPDGSNASWGLYSYSGAGHVIQGHYFDNTITLNPATRSVEPTAILLYNQGNDVQGIRYHYEDYPFFAVTEIFTWDELASTSYIGSMLNHNCVENVNFPIERYEFQYDSYFAEGTLDIHYGPFQRSGRRVEDLQTLYNSADPSQVVLTGWGAGVNIPSSQARDSNGQVRIETGAATGAVNPVQITINFADGNWEVPPTPRVQFVGTDDAAVVGVDVPVRVQPDVDKLDIFAYMDVDANKYYDFSYQLLG